MSAIEEGMLQKPNLRSKGSRFGIHVRSRSTLVCKLTRAQTGNTLKWSTQDYLASRKDYGLIRKESLNLHTRDAAGRPPLVDDDGIGFEVEYSINRKRRWLLAEELEAAETVIHEITERVYSPEPSRSPWLRMLTKYTYRAKSDEYVARMCLPFLANSGISSPPTLSMSLLTQIWSPLCAISFRIPDLEGRMLRGS